MSKISLDEACYNRGIAKFYLENFQGALEDLNGCVQSHPNNTKFLIARGIIYSLQINPDKADAYYNRGIIYYQLGDDNKAYKDFKKAADIYKQKNEEIDYQDAIEKIKLLLNTQCNENREKNEEIDYQNTIEKIKSLLNTQSNENKVKINLPQNYSEYLFDVLVQHKDMWEQLLKDLANSCTNVKNNVKSSWQIVSRKNKNFIRIKFYGSNEICSVLSQKMQKYKESYLENMKSDFDIDIINKPVIEENFIDNTEIEFDDINDNNYAVQFESDNYDTWLDCGYMNDIINPYEVY